MIRQLLYVSRAVVPEAAMSLDDIFEASRHNNAIDGVTGLLFSDTKRFVQVIEGSHDAIAALMARIGADPRHDHIVILHDVSVASREFGGWSMADRRRGEGNDSFDEHLCRLLRGASPAIQDAFVDLLLPA